MSVKITLERRLVTNSRIKPDYRFKIPQYESQRTQSRFTTTSKYVENKNIPAIVELVNPLQQRKYCQFSGGGDLLNKTNIHSCVIVQDKIEDGGILPVDQGTAVQHLAVEMKKRRS